MPVFCRHDGRASGLVGTPTVGLCGLVLDGGAGQVEGHGLALQVLDLDEAVPMLGLFDELLEQCCRGHIFDLDEAVPRQGQVVSKDAPSQRSSGRTLRSRCLQLACLVRDVGVAEGVDERRGAGVAGRGTGP